MFNALGEIYKSKIAGCFIVIMYHDLEDVTGNAECNALEGQLGIGQVGDGDGVVRSHFDQGVPGCILVESIARLHSNGELLKVYVKLDLIVKEKVPT